MLVFFSLLVVGYAVFKISTYEQIDSEVHLESKNDYLRALSQLELSAQMPNIVFVLYDDMGYGDLGFTGSAAISTPNIDRLAKNGLQITNFYSPSPVCTPSRFGFLTGRFAERGHLSHVVFPKGSVMSNYTKFRGANVRIPAHEITLPEVLKAVGYATGMVGKWHLGDISPSQPNDLGFDEFFGSLYSNDMEPFALYRNREIAVESPVNQELLSALYEKTANEFVSAHRQTPFFLYLAHSFPHEPLHVEDERLGRSPAGLYGDVVEELDEDIGSLIDALRTAGVLDNTLIIISSDNGPWYLGDPGAVRGRKGDTFEGGMRVPFIAHWPRRIAPGQIVDGLSMGTDIFPTVLDLLGLPSPTDRLIDGKSILKMLTDGEPSPHDYLYYYSGKLLAIRDKDFKYVPRRGIHYGMATIPIGVAMPKGPYLFDMRSSGRESYDIKAYRPDVLSRFLRLYQATQKSLEGNREGWLQ